MALSINRYNKTLLEVGKGTINLSDAAATFYIMLMTGSHSFTATHSQRTDVSANQIPTANGYTQATGGDTGKALASVTWTEASGVSTWDAADVVWTASGGNITASHGVIFDDESASDLLLHSVDFNGSQSADDTATFTISWNASGIMTVSN